MPAVRPLGCPPVFEYTFGWSEILKRDGQDSFDIFAGVLTQCQESRFTGALRIGGNPGAVFQFCGGLVVAAESPGSPGVDTLLIRSGRISAGEWDAALCDEALNKPGQPAIVRSGRIDEAGLREIVLSSLWDGAFAVVAGEIDEYVADSEPQEVSTLVLPATDGVGAAAVLAETTRRLDAFASLPHPVSPYRERVVPAGAVELVGLRREIIGQADGRRTARDIAFAIGQGLYPVTVEVSRMLGDGIVQVGSPIAPTIPAHSDADSLLQRPQADQCLGHDGGALKPLPVRLPGRSLPDDKPR